MVKMMSEGNLLHHNYELKLTVSQKDEHCCCLSSCKQLLLDINWAIGYSTGDKHQQLVCNLQY